MGVVEFAGKWPVLGRHELASGWLRIWTDLGRAPRTIDAYARGLAEYLLVCERENADPATANRAHVAVFVRELTSRPSRRGPNVVSIDSGAGLSNATIQQRLVPAQRLGIDRVYSGERIWAGTMWLYVAGILNPAVLVPDVDSSILVGFPAAEHYLGFDGHPSAIYVRAQAGHVDAVDSLLGATANPQNPGEVDVSQPSAALVAQADAQGAFDDLFLGLGAVALLVGAVGVANIMIISVLERRSEIGLRRALGATRGHIRAQFLAEAVLLALIGGAVGVGAGALSTAVYASAKHELVVIPALAWGGGMGAAILIGAVAGLWPALRAARMSPTQALWSM